MTVNLIPRIPLLDGEPWHITTPPDLGNLSYEDSIHEMVDHAIWQSVDGKWHCWSCIRYTRVGRMLYGWEGNSLEQPNWKPVGITMRADRHYGESLNDWFGEEWIQAPHVIQHGNLFYMFYGGHNTENGECQICLATSKDGRTFKRYKNEQGFSRVFVGPGDARDPMVIQVGDQWIGYYSANDNGSRYPNKIYARTSTDLTHWTGYQEVSWGGFASGTHILSAQCPFVVFKDGFYYMFRTSEYYPPARTNVYRSENPFDFGINSDEKWVATLRVAAPEIIQVGDQYYISTVEDLKGGIQLFKLKWI